MGPAAWLRAPSDQRVRVDVSLHLESLELLIQVCHVPLSENRSNLGCGDGLAALVVEALEFTDLGGFDVALHLLDSALATEPMSALKFNCAKFPLRDSLVGL